MRIDILEKRLFEIIIIGIILLIFANLNISSSESTDNILINEIMSNPINDDQYNEWIEIYNPTSNPINVSGWSITDNSQQDFLMGDYDNGNGITIIQSEGYGIITDKGTKLFETMPISEDIILLQVDDTNIGNGLGNSYDKILLKNEKGIVIDSVEWGKNYSDVPGQPVKSSDEGSSIGRISLVDTDNSSNDFYNLIKPTPGYENEPVKNPEIKLDLYPKYIPKIQIDKDYSMPFGIKIQISNYNPLEEYLIKICITGKNTQGSIANQIWDKSSWIFSNYYQIIETDGKGNWSDWFFLRFKKDYKGYNNIINESSAILNIKTTKNNRTMDEITEELLLLDMDNSTKNGSTGGYISGFLDKNILFPENKMVTLEDENKTIVSIYKTEDNNIDEGYPSINGYYKIYAPIGNYTLNILNKNFQVLYILENITVRQGGYDVKILSDSNSYLIERDKPFRIPFKIKNCGKYYDTYEISIDNSTYGWLISLENEQISLNPDEIYNNTVYVEPCNELKCRTRNFTIKVTSTGDISESDSIDFKINALASDLAIYNVKIYDENDNISYTFKEGDSLKIKANIKNLGNKDARNVSVNIYYNVLDEAHLIGKKQYETVTNYQKSITMKWDTSDIKSDVYTIYLVADYKEMKDEYDLENNQYSTIIILYNSSPSSEEKKVLITELYYHTHPGIKNEFVHIFNPTDIDINISGWYLTNNPFRNKEDQKKMIFPENSWLNANTGVYVAQNASSFLWETGKLADFEYETNSNDTIPQLYAENKLVLSNTGGKIALKDNYNHTLDLVVYGEEYNYSSDWKGLPVPNPGQGVILKRGKDKNSSPIDTNSNMDWESTRRYAIGQSDFPNVKINCTGEIKTFVSPDCSFDTIVNELRKAKNTIYLNIYEFTDPFLCDELISVLKRNISVFIFLEGSPIGGISDNEKYILKRLEVYGAEIRLIVNDKDNDVYARYSFDHGKYLVIDYETVIVESCNWAKSGIPKNPSYGNREWGVVVRNKDVAEYFLKVFFDDWNPKRCDSYSIDDMNFSLPYDFVIDESSYSGYYKPEFTSAVYHSNSSVIPVFSPDTSYSCIYDMINSARESIYIEQLYIYRDWDDQINPFIDLLVNKSNQGVDIKIIMNYNPGFKDSNYNCNLTKNYLEQFNIEVKFVYSNWSYFSNVHNKGMIIDNSSVLISSINWNENSVRRNREAGLIINNEEIAKYYSEVFFYDWNLLPKSSFENEVVDLFIDNNTIYIITIFTMTFALIAHDWRKREWT